MKTTTPAELQHLTDSLGREVDRLLGIETIDSADVMAVAEERVRVILRGADLLPIDLRAFSRDFESVVVAGED
jgi:hypothetical protein